MTVREKLAKMLEEHGLWPEEAGKVLDSLTDKKHAQALVEVYGKAAKGYPESVIVTAWIIVSKAAVEWIDENKPQHFARRMFDSAE